MEEGRLRRSPRSGVTPTCAFDSEAGILTRRFGDAVSISPFLTPLYFYAYHFLGENNMPRNDLQGSLDLLVLKTYRRPAASMATALCSIFKKRQTNYYRLRRTLSTRRSIESRTTAGLPRVGSNRDKQKSKVLQTDASRPKGVAGSGAQL